MSEQVTVEVTITERVKYTTRVKMPREKFEALDADGLEIESFGIVTDDEA